MQAEPAHDRRRLMGSAHRWTDRGAGRWTDRGAGRWTDRGAGRWTDRGAGRWTHRGTRRRTGWWTGRWTGVWVVAVTCLLVPWVGADHDDGQTESSCASRDPNYSATFDHDRDCVRNNRDRAVVALLDLEFPQTVWLGQGFQVQGRIMSNETLVTPTPPPSPIGGLTVLVVLDSNMVGAPSRTAGVGFTDGDGRFNALSVLQRNHQVTVPTGHVLFGAKYDEPRNVAWNNFNISRIELGPNPFLVWSYATDPLAGPQDPQYVDLMAFDATTGITHRTHAVGRALSAVQSVLVRTQTHTVFGNDVTNVVDGEPVVLSLRVLDALGRPLSNQDIVVAFQGQQKTVGTGGLGAATATFEGVVVPAPGAYPVTATYAQDAHPYTEGSSGQAQVFVRFPTSLGLSLQPSEALPGQDVTVSGRLQDHRGDGVGGQALRFVFDAGDLLRADGQPVAVTTSGTGHYSFVHRVPADASVGTFPLQAVFDGSPDDRYLPAVSGAGSLTIRREADIAFDDGRLEVVRQAKVTVAGTFADNADGSSPVGTGRPIAGGTRVTVHWGNNVLPAKQAIVAPETGRFQAEFDVPAEHPLSPEPVRVRAVHDAPGSFYHPAEATREVHVVSDTVLTLEGGTFPRGTAATVKGRLLDDQAAPVPDQQVRILWEDDAPVTVTTGPDGRFTLQRDIPADATPRVAPVKAVYPGSTDGVYRASETAAIDHVIVASTRIAVEDTQLLRGAVGLGGRLLDDRDQPVQGTVRARLLDAAGEHLNATGTAGAEGTFTVAGTLPPSTPLGAYTAVFTFAGQPPFLLGSQATASVHVVAATVLEVDSVGALVRNQPFSIGGTLREDTGAGVAGATVRAALDEAELAQAVTVEGRFTFDGTLPHVAKGEHTLRLGFDGGDHLLPTHTNVTVIVKAATKLEIVLPATVTENGELVAVGTLRDDVGDPVVGEEVCVQTRSGNRFQRPVCLRTDEEGGFRFARAIDANATVPVVVGAQFNGSLLYVGSVFGEGVVPVHAAQSVPWGTFGLAAGAVAAVAAGLAAIWWFLLRRRLALHSIHDILQDVIYDLEAGDAAAAAIIEAYERLERSLRRSGHLRRRHETVREFEQALVAALSVPADLMGRLLSVFEVARYSDHAVGKEQHAEALRTFAQVDAHVATALRRPGPAASVSSTEVA